MTSQVMRLSVSIPRDLLNETDKIAHAKRLSRSKLIAECLSNLVESEKKMLLASRNHAMSRAQDINSLTILWLLTEICG
jgi:metal-responsive CopG/Arc/MetJ family transcriptional regulator